MFHKFVLFILVLFSINLSYSNSLFDFYNEEYTNEFKIENFSIDSKNLNDDNFFEDINFYFELNKNLGNNFLVNLHFRNKLENNKKLTFS